MRASTSSTCCRIVDRAKLKPLKIVVNAGNGGAGLVVDRLEPHLPFEFIKIHHEPDGTFPNGVPNPMLEENRRRDRSKRSASTAPTAASPGTATSTAASSSTSSGGFIEGYYIVGLLAVGVPEARARRAHRARSAPDLEHARHRRSRSAARPCMSKSGHAFMKDVMREADAVYGGEMSAHHYFRDFAYCDSGHDSLAARDAADVRDRQAALGSWSASASRLFPASGEINRKVRRREGDHRSACRSTTSPAPRSIDFTDGLSMEFDQLALQPALAPIPSR